MLLDYIEKAINQLSGYNIRDLQYIIKALQGIANRNYTCNITQIDIQFLSEPIKKFIADKTYYFYFAINNKKEQDNYDTVSDTYIYRNEDSYMIVIIDPPKQG